MLVSFNSGFMPFNLIFLGNQENPELIWNDDSREHLCAVVQRLATE